MLHDKPFLAMCSGSGLMFLFGLGAAVAQAIEPSYMSFQDVYKLIKGHETEVHRGAVSWAEAMTVIAMMLSLIGGLAAMIYRAGVQRLDSHGAQIAKMQDGMVRISNDLAGLKGSWEAESKALREMQQTNYALLMADHKENAMMLAELNAAREARGQAPMRFPDPPQGHPAHGSSA